MNTYYLNIFFQLFLLTREFELNIRQLKKSRNRKTIEAGISIILVLTFILLVMIIISNIIRKRTLERTQRYNLNDTQKQLNLKKKVYLFQNELKPKILKLKISENFYNECTICLDNVKENDIITYTPCNHIFHFDCFKQYMFITTDTHCPLCKFDFFSLLNEKDIDFNNINIDNLDFHFNTIDYCFINNLSFNDDKNHYNSNNDFFIIPINVKKKGNEINDVNNNENSNKSKLKIDHFCKRKIIPISEEVKSEQKNCNVNQEKNESCNVNSSSDDSY